MALQRCLVISVVLLIADGYKSTLERKDKDCIEKWNSCDGTPRCCGTLQCYWADGYSLLEDGVCVECIDRSLTCQTDDQCCGDLVCQKQGSLHIDGICDILYKTGDWCNRDDNCESGKCDEPWHGIGHGVCE